ncbi:MAG: hypothetical protein ACU0BK_16060 [Shimia sp.]|jgi:hypothetical protein|uniref:hypothetical protein n=1 Tax=Shimia sp. TaxID=1954381 RepID=UPI004059424A
MSDISLEEFVEETLLSIARGVLKAKDVSKDEDIIPIALHRVNDKDTKNGDQLVKFSVGVEATKRTAGSAGAKVGGPLVSLVTGSASLEGSHEKSVNSVHRIEFSVPINFSSRWKANKKTEES